MKCAGHSFDFMPAPFTTSRYDFPISPGLLRFPSVQIFKSHLWSLLENSSRLPVRRFLARLDNANESFSRCYLRRGRTAAAHNGPALIFTPFWRGPSSCGAVGWPRGKWNVLSLGKRKTKIQDKSWAPGFMRRILDNNFKLIYAMMMTPLFGFSLLHHRETSLSFPSVARCFSFFIF